MAEIEKLDIQSMNIKEEQIDKLKTLFPEIFTEGNKIDWKRLKLTLGEDIDTGKERYGMNWPGKADCYKTIQQPSIATLVPARDESIDFDTTQNLFIEGDNLEVLKLLQKSYLGKVKMFYFDPPYNTGNDFIYPDNFSENLQTYLEYTGQVDSEGRKFGTNTETDGRFHSKWINMMYPRLFLAKNLLREDGVVFISIDDSEVNNLKTLCNEIFGEENFVASLVYDKNRKNDAKYFSIGHEYILVYFKNYQKVNEFGTIFRIRKEGVEEVKSLFEKLRELYNDDWEKITEELKKLYLSWPEDDDRKPLARFNKVDLKGPFRDDGNISWPGGGGPKYEVIHPITKKACKIPDAGWRFPNAFRMNEEIESGRVVFGQDESTLPRIRRNLFEADKEVMKSVHFSYAQTATMEFNKIFENKRIFENPKNPQDLKRLIEYVTTNYDEDLIVDIFAGSCSTAHAVLELNKEDNGNRRFICVQLPQPISENSEAADAGYETIADIGKERIRRISKRISIDIENEKIQKGKIEKKAHQNPTIFDTVNQPIQKYPINRSSDNGFKVFKLTPSNFKIWDSNIEKTPEAVQLAMQLHTENINELASQDALLYEILLKAGFELTTTIEKLNIEGKPVFSVSDGQLLICLEKEITHGLIKGIAENKPVRVVCLDEGFRNNDQLKTNAMQIMKCCGVIKFQTI